MQVGTDFSKRVNMITGVLCCCGAPLTIPIKHWSWCKNFRSIFIRQNADDVLSRLVTTELRAYRFMWE